MTLLVLTYHRACIGPDGNSPEMLDAHFEYIAATYPNVLPGDRIRDGAVSVCLCFDGAFYDLHAVVLPLLQKHGLRAVVAVAPSHIREDAIAPPAERLSIPSAEAYARPDTGGLCTWRELRQVANTGHCAIAALGYSNIPLDRTDTDYETEVHVPRTLLGARLNAPIESFVFPLGRTTRHGLAEVKSGYPYAFANCGASNSGWHHRQLFRIPADNLRHPTEPFEAARLLRYRASAVWHRLNQW